MTSGIMWIAWLFFVAITYVLFIFYIKHIMIILKGRKTFCCLQSTIYRLFLGHRIPQLPNSTPKSLSQFLHHFDECVRGLHSFSAPEPSLLLLNSPWKDWEGAEDTVVPTEVPTEGWGFEEWSLHTPGGRACRTEPGCCPSWATCNSSPPALHTRHMGFRPCRSPSCPSARTATHHTPRSSLEPTSPTAEGEATQLNMPLAQSTISLRKCAISLQHTGPSFWLLLPSPASRCPRSPLGPLL